MPHKGRKRAIKRSRKASSSRGPGLPKNFRRVQSRGIFKIHLDNTDTPSIVPLQKLSAGLDRDRAFRLVKISMTTLPVNVPGGNSGVIRVGQKGERWAQNGPQNFLELGSLMPSITNTTTRTFKPYGAGAGIFVEQPSADDFQLEFLTCACTYQPNLGVTLSIAYTATWELEIPETSLIGSF